MYVFTITRQISSCQCYLLIKRIWVWMFPWYGQLTVSWPWRCEPPLSTKRLFYGWPQSRHCLNWPDAESSTHLVPQAGQYAKLYWEMVLEWDLTLFSIRAKPFEVATTAGSATASKRSSCPHLCAPLFLIRLLSKLIKILEYHLEF